ncbi:MAG: isochorismatase family protein, partial [Nitrospinota bacterium]
MDREVEATAELLKLAREKNLLVFFTVVGYEEGAREAGMFARKVPSLKTVRLGTPLVEVDDRLKPLPGERVIVKKFQSAFFGTNLASILVAEQVDTLIITGCVTSGCIRASSIDSMQHGFQTILPMECIADRAQEPHEANLFDIGAKNADVLPLKEVMDYLKAMPPMTYEE